MSNFKSIDALLRYAQNQVNEALKSEVAPIVEQTLAEKIDENVYQSYMPTTYQRRGELGNPANIQSELIDDGKLFTKDVAAPSPSVTGAGYSGSDTAFSQWIDQGLVPNIFTSSEAPWQAPAMFYAETEEQLKKSHAVQKALKRGLAKKGIKTTVTVGK